MVASFDTLTAPDLQEGGARPIPASSDVREDFADTKPINGGFSGWGRLVGSAVLAVASTVTSIALPPPYDRRRETSSVICLFAASRGRPISLAEARELALGALAQAEQRRATFAEREARAFAIWEEGA